MNNEKQFENNVKQLEEKLAKAQEKLRLARQKAEIAERERNRQYQIDLEASRLRNKLAAALEAQNRIIETFSGASIIGIEDNTDTNYDMSVILKFSNGLGLIFTADGDESTSLSWDVIK